MDELKRMRAEPERQDETFSLGQEEMWTLSVPFFLFLDKTESTAMIQYFKARK